MTSNIKIIFTFFMFLLRDHFAGLMAGILGKARPIVVVLGATGAGKSKLAIEIAQKFNGEVVSADAVQMYKGLDIVTNKVTEEERAMVKHHCIDFLDPLSAWTVVQFPEHGAPHH